MSDASAMPEKAREVLDLLLAGNQRYIAGAYRHPHQSPERRSEISEGQHPIAAVLTCSDSRVSPELIFDQGLGDLFEVRVAGNALGDLGLGSLEYAAAHLDVPLLMVLGHSKCGAMTGAAAGGEHEAHIGSVVAALRPALDEVQGHPGDLVDNAARANARRVARALRESEPLISELVAVGRTAVVAAYYDIDTGGVEILE
jgi:carbonic anhydrase